MIYMAEVEGKTQLSKKNSVDKSEVYWKNVRMGETEVDQLKRLIPSMKHGGGSIMIAALLPLDLSPHVRSICVLKFNRNWITQQDNTIYALNVIL